MVLCIPPAILNHQALQLNLWRHDTPVTAEVLCIECLFCLEGICFRLCCLCKMHASPVWWTQCDSAAPDGVTLQCADTKNPQDNLAVLHEAFAQEPFGMGIRELSHGCPWALGSCWGSCWLSTFHRFHGIHGIHGIHGRKGRHPTGTLSGRQGRQGTSWESVGNQLGDSSNFSNLPFGPAIDSLHEVNGKDGTTGQGLRSLRTLNYIIVIFSIPGPTLQVSPTSSGQSIKTAYPKAKECEDAIAALPSEARLLAYLALEVHLDVLDPLDVFACLCVFLTTGIHWIILWRKFYVLHSDFHIR